MMTEHLQEAIQIITRSGNIKVSFNVPVKDNYANVYDILIHNSSASVINELVAAGFSLSMNDKGLSVTKY